MNKESGDAIINRKRCKIAFLSTLKIVKQISAR